MKIERRKNGCGWARQLRAELARILRSDCDGTPVCAAKGVGEIGLIDNLTVLHASYYARLKFKGYPIALRYLF